MSDIVDGQIIIFSSPSGAGKTTLVKLLEKKENFFVSVSHTTRKPRPNEVNGVDYHFVSEKEFQDLNSDNKIYEYAKIYNHYYGTSKDSVENLIKKNDIIFDIDWQGTKQLSKIKNLNLIKIFLLPPNKSELKSRLIKRGQGVDIDRRLKAFEIDEKHWQDYDYILINENLEKCYNQVEKIIQLNKIKLEQSNKL